MKYSDLVEVNKDFQSSINLEYDIDKIEKIRSYIPTEQSVKVLGEFLRSYYYNNDSKNRASVLIGPYGRGKSHLLLILSALTSLDLRAKTKKDKDTAIKAQKDLCNKIKSVDPEVGALAEAIVKSNIRTLPVIINSNTVDINQSFLIAINFALTQAGLQNLLPNTYFDSAIAIIDKWESYFPDAYSTLKKELKSEKTDINKLRIELKQYSQKAYSLFCKCYPKIAAGTEFNPLTNMDVVKLYLSVTKALYEQTEYKGITVIFDEFSKFLESNLDKSKMLNFKIIQDLAEAATRSGKSQLHFVCITHKEILDYSSSDSFKTVEGRFRKIRFVASSEQSYELIANAIVKKEKFKVFAEQNSDVFNTISSNSSVTNLFSDLTDDSYNKKLVYGCFPMTPLSAYSLLNISELVGQNERTLFTFLAQKDEHTFSSFIDNEINLSQLITVDYIYDYFEELFKKEIFNSSVHSVWAKTDSAIRQVNDPVSIKILKGIAVINIIKDERFRPVAAHIKASLMLNDIDFEESMSELIKNHIVSKRDSSEYVLLTANGVDIQKSIENYINNNLSRINLCKTLTEACELGFVIPREYNDKFSMLRCFKNIYMDGTVFSKYRNAQQILSEFTYDGLIIHIICEDKSVEEKVIKKINTYTQTPQIVLCMTKSDCNIEHLLKEYEAAIQLLTKSSQKEDHRYIEELEVFIEDLQRRIRTVVFDMYAPSSEYSYFINANGTLNVQKKSELNQEISRICSDCYNLTPILNNEMVNKRMLNAQNTKARDLVVDWILSHSEDLAIPCMEGSGPEVSVFKSAFKYTGLDKKCEAYDNGTNQVLRVIDRFITGCEDEKSNFINLYQELYAAPYGMRKGVIPLYIAYVMRQYKDSIVLYFKSKEIELSANVLSNLNENPENYQLLIENGTADRNLFLDNLQNLFSDFTDDGISSINRVYSIVKSMQSWFRSLPDYTKKFKIYLVDGETENINNSTDILRKYLMKFEINSRELLFETLATELSENQDLEECFKNIEKIKAFLDSHITQYRMELNRKVTNLFMPGYKGGLSHAVMSWYKSVPDNTKKHIFDSNTNALLSIANSTSTYNDDDLLDNLVNVFVSIAVEDWNDTLAKTFVKEIGTSINVVNDYVEIANSDLEDGKLMISLGGVKLEKTFSSDSISPLGKTALNNLESVFEEYNDSLEPDEQLAILAKLINSIIN